MIWAIVIEVSFEPQRFVGLMGHRYEVLEFASEAACRDRGRELAFKEARELYVKQPRDFRVARVYECARISPAYAALIREARHLTGMDAQVSFEPGDH